MPDIFYFVLSDAPEFIFLLVFTKLVLFWVESVTPDVEPGMDYTSLSSDYTGFWGSNDTE